MSRGKDVHKSFNLTVNCYGRADFDKLDMCSVFALWRIVKKIWILEEVKL